MCRCWFRPTATAPTAAAKGMSGTIRFLLDGHLHTVACADPTMSLLNYLRYDAVRTGTKEGCAEGDCGACTVVIGELIGEHVQYRAMNACILFLPTLDGKELLTVESLAGKDGTLHPVQQALVETHGSQCGFCTPGFVMSLYVLYLKGIMPSKSEIEDTLAGNLCRCTGYGPIIEAASRMFELGQEALADVPAKAAALRAIQRTDTLELVGKGMITHAEKRYFAPVTLDALADLVAANPGATILAGGTDVGLWVTKMHRELSTVIYLGGVAALKETCETADAIEIGAGVCYSDAADTLARHYPDMGEIIRRIGSTQIRNSGTVGGNIANGSPIGDSPPLLIAANAQIVLRHGTDVRTVALNDYFLEYGKQDRAPGEFLVKIIVPKPAPNLVFKAYKLSKRFDQDISAVCAGFALVMDGDIVEDAWLAYGGMAATPKRAAHAETALVGKPFSDASVKAAMAAMMDDFTPLSDMRASADYRMQAAQNLLMKMFLECTGGNDIRLAGQREAVHV